MINTLNNPNYSTHTYLNDHRIVTILPITSSLYAVSQVPPDRFCRDALIEIDGSQKSHTSLIETVCIFIGCNVKVNREEDICAGGIEVHW